MSGPDSDPGPEGAGPEGAGPESAGPESGGPQGVGPAQRLDLAAYLPYRLSILSNTVSGAIAAIYEARYGLSVADWRIVAILGMAPDRPLTQTALCARTRMDKVQVSRAVKRLLESGRIVRETDSTDRRRAHLRLTAQGRAVYDDVAPATLAWERDLLSRLTPAEAAILDTVIARLQQVADEMAEAPLSSG